ncbi:MAG TPA: DUF6807 family protein, partial [Chloroflexota bacterium]|nr:DUF6807 family protein [Chloroflexota bacterium]
MSKRRCGSHKMRTTTAKDHQGWIFPSTSLGLVVVLAVLLVHYSGCGPLHAQDQEVPPEPTPLVIQQDEEARTISIYRAGEETPILTQHARPDFRPYLHPIAAPDGRGVLTEYSPGHHPHQTGLYWGFTRVNGRDYFHHPGAEYWDRVSADVLKPEGEEVSWQTVYNLLDEDGDVVLTETQTWTMQERDGMYVLDLQWQGKAYTDVTIGKYDYGGLFLRMPWREGIEGSVV